MAKKAKKAKKKVVSKKEAVVTNALADRLKELRSKFDIVNVEAATRGSVEFPVGRGQTAVVASCVVKIIETGQVMFGWVLEGTDGDVAGGSNLELKKAINNTIWTTDQQGVDLPVENVQKRMSFVKADFKAVGIDFDACYDEWIEELNAAPTAAEFHIEEVEGCEVLVDVWKKDEFFNYGIVGLAEGSVKQVEAEETETNLTAAEIRQGCIDEDDAMADLAKTVGIDPDEYSWEELAEAMIPKLT